MSFLGVLCELWVEEIARFSDFGLLAAHVAGSDMVGRKLKRTSAASGKAAFPANPIGIRAFCGEFILFSLYVSLNDRFTSSASMHETTRVVMRRMISRH